MEAAADQASLLGRVLDGRYRIVAELGEGGMGVVYRAEHLKLGRPVALKVLLSEYGKNPNLRGRFEREARALAALHHPNVVTVTDYGVTEDDLPYLVMELLEGRTLKERLEEGPMDSGPVRDLMRQILRGLAYAHGQGVAHRDLKPGNLFLQQLPGGHEHAKILDFGLAKFVAGDADPASGPALTRTGAVLGTPAYMAPEQASGESSDARSDTYAMGVLLFEMLSGKRPFDGEPGEILRQHLLSPVPRLEDLSPYVVETPALRAFLERAMSKDRGSRFQNATEMLAAFDALPDPLTREGESAIVARPSQNPTAAGLGRHDAALRASEPTQDASQPHHPAAMGTAATLPGHVDRRGDPSAPAVRTASSPRSPLPLVIVAFIGLVVLGGIVGGGVLVATLGGDADDESGEVAATAPTAPLPRLAEPTEGSGSSGGGAASAEQERTHEEAEAAPVAPSAPSAPQTNPWDQRPIPSLLSTAKRQTDAHRRLSNRAMDRLRSYRRDHPEDVRAHLLLARGYLERGWRPDAMEWYENAFEASPSAAGDPRTLEDLIVLAAHARTSTRATRLLRQGYGDRAAEAMDRALASGDLDRDDANRLQRIREGW